MVHFRTRFTGKPERADQFPVIEGCYDETSVLSGPQPPGRLFHAYFPMLFGRRSERTRLGFERLQAEFPERLRVVLRQQPDLHNPKDSASSPLFRNGVM